MQPYNSETCRLKGFILKSDNIFWATNTYVTLKSKAMIITVPVSDILV